MNYDLAKQLKDAGFPQPDQSEGDYSGHYSCGCAERRANGTAGKQVYDCGNDRFYYPTLSELIEACGVYFYSLTNTHHTNPRTDDAFPDWVAESSIARQPSPFSKEKDMNLGRLGDTPEEAVANLWLALNKKDAPR